MCYGTYLLQVVDTSFSMFIVSDDDWLPLRLVLTSGLQCFVFKSSTFLSRPGMKETRLCVLANAKMEERPLFLWPGADEGEALTCYADMCLPGPVS